LDENRWYTLDENGWYTLDENKWYTLDENGVRFYEKLTGTH
jgi:hypothetical protein